MISIIESKKHTPSIAEIEALLYGHETRLTHYNKEAWVLSSPSLNYTQGYSHSNSHKSGDPGGTRGLYGRGSGGRVAIFLIAMPDVVVVALVEVVVVANLPTFSVKFALSTDILPMSLSV